MNKAFSLQQDLRDMLFFATLAGALVVNTFANETYTENAGTEGNGDHVVGPEYSLAPELSDLGNPKGKQFEFSMLWTT